MSGSRQKKVRKIVKATFFKDFFDITAKMKLSKRIELGWRIIVKRPYKDKKVKRKNG